MRSWFALAALILMIWPLACPRAVLARPLDDSSCTQLDQERVALEAAGILTDLRLNQAEIKALTPEKQKRMGRYVEVSAQVLFRCQSAPQPPQAAGAIVTSPAAPAVPVKPAKTAATDPGKAKPGAVKKKP